MDTAQLLLISQARQGEPQSIAALIQYELRHQGIEVCGWKKGTTLHLELMGCNYPARSEVLKFIKNGLEFLKAEGIEAVRVVVYVEGEEHPRWVDRISLRGAVQKRVMTSSQENVKVQDHRQTHHFRLNHSVLRPLVQSGSKVRQMGTQSWQQVKNPARLAALAASMSIVALGFSLSLRTVQPSFAEQEQQMPLENSLP